MKCVVKDGYVWAVSDGAFRRLTATIDAGGDYDLGMIGKCLGVGILASDLEREALRRRVAFDTFAQHDVRNRN